MTSTLLRLLPASFIRVAGRLWRNVPILREPIGFLGRTMAQEGRIAHGAGKGLFFNARGSNPGYVAGTSEPLEQELVLRYSRSGGVVYDLGANIGFYAVIAARAVGPSGMVYAFEPTTALAERARSNGLKNSLHNLEIVEAAVCLQDGTVEFETSETNLINSIRRVSSQSDRSVSIVRSIRLDTFAVGHRPPDLLLIDIEGAEIEALESGLKTISSSRPVIMVEVHALGRQFIDFFERTLQPMGYVGSTYEGQSLPAEPVRYHALLVPTD
jgi:FkbM family methyltransferase